ncbi:EpsG family protein [Acinetobacter bohemicus]|uniref:EpsG family protein n=1 Tax=Acinetobacter TaxID=469 RepID=UPI00209AD0C5|nr:MULTISPECIES: EpsG family protein [Acinetobacter]MCO8043587.1 EpsG family protein [Acinetobacter sp. S4400-12]MCU7224827.1 EpsG family protein [Acinetobacter bohemicus]
MLPYILLAIYLLICILLSFILKRKKSILLIIGLSLFCALKGIEVGSDNYMYETIYETLSDYKSSRFYGSLEFGFIYLGYMFNKIGLSYFYFVFFLTFLYLYSFNKLNKKLSENYYLSWIIFLFFAHYTFIFNGLRQAVAIGLCWLSLYAFLNRKILYTILLIFVALMFHTSAVIFSIVILFFYIKCIYRKYFSILWTVFFIFGINLIFGFAGQINERYEGYAEFKSEDTGVGALFFLFFNLITLFLLSKILKIKNESFYIMLNILYLGFVIVFSSFLYGFSASGLMRLSRYFVWTLIFLWPIIFLKIDMKYRPLSYLIFTLFAFFYYLLATYSYGELVPYYIG